MLVGPEHKIRDCAAEHGIDLAGRQIVDAPHSHARGRPGRRAGPRGQGRALMKGSLHTDELMREVTSSATGLRTERRISHVFVMDVPRHPDTLFITDAAINIFPDLDAKRDIVQNAIDLWAGDRAWASRKVAILSAVETVTTKIPSTIEAAALCKMADRGQITGGAARRPARLRQRHRPRGGADQGHRLRRSPATRQILVVPDLEAGNMLAKNLTFLAHADAAGIVLGARVPIILTSRADSVRTRLASCAVAALYANARRRDHRGARRLMDAILVVNAGSSSLKFQVFALDGGGLERRVRGQIDGIGVAPRLRAADGSGGDARRAQLPTGQGATTFPSAMAETSDWLRALEGLELRAIGHRVVHGGPEFDQRRSWSTRRCSTGSPVTRRWRRCTSRTTWRRSDWRWRSTPRCRRSPASTPPSTAAAPRTPTATPCRARSTTRASAATASMA